MDLSASINSVDREGHSLQMMKKKDKVSNVNFQKKGLKHPFLTIKRMEIQTHVVVEILRLLPAAVKNVGVNGYVSEHDIHQPNVTNFFFLQICFFYKIFFFFSFDLGDIREHFFFIILRRVFSFGSQQKKKSRKKYGKNKKDVRHIFLKIIT